jgi:hypothetical protein
MRGKGICYDTGFFNRGVSTHEPFEPEVVARELGIVREDLHCNAVRITGGRPGAAEGRGRSRRRSRAGGLAHALPDRSRR